MVGLKLALGSITNTWEQGCNKCATWKISAFQEVWLHSKDQLRKWDRFWFCGTRINGENCQFLQETGAKSKPLLPYFCFCYSALALQWFRLVHVALLHVCASASTIKQLLLECIFLFRPCIITLGYWWAFSSANVIQGILKQKKGYWIWIDLPIQVLPWSWREWL